MTLTHSKHTGDRIFLSYKQPSPNSNRTKTTSIEITTLKVPAVTALIQYLDFNNIDFEYIHTPVYTKVLGDIQLSTPNTISKDELSTLFNDNDADLVRLRRGTKND